MRWEAQELEATDAAALPGLAKLHGLVRSVTTPEFAGITFHEVVCKSALNKVPMDCSAMMPKTISAPEGGIICPNVPPAATEPVASASE